MAEKGNRKLLWIILFSLVAVVFCYLFIVVFFYYVSPYDISLKITFWPFVSSKSIGQMYGDAIVDVNFKYQDDEFVDREISAVGVNVKKDGVIILPYSEIFDCSDFSQIKILTKAGKVFAGDFLYANKDYNIAIIKCKNVDGSNSGIKIPFVKMTDYSIHENNNVIVTSGNLAKTSVWTGKVTETDISYAVTNTDNGNKYVEYCIEEGYIIKLDYGNYSFDGGIVFDNHANLLGFSYSDTLKILDDRPTEFYIQTANSLPYFVDNVIASYNKGEEYANPLVDAFKGFDGIESKRIEELTKVEGGKNYIYFNGLWREYTAELEHYYMVPTAGYYLFEKLNYGDISINAGSVVTGITISKVKFDVETKVDLLDLLFLLKKGDQIQIWYKTLSGADWTEAPQSLVV